jgi:hypothetical protein
LHPERLRQRFKDEYLTSQAYLFLVRAMGVVSIAAGLAVAVVYLRANHA